MCNISSTSPPLGRLRRAADALVTPCPRRRRRIGRNEPPPRPRLAEEEGRRAPPRRPLRGGAPGPVRPAVAGPPPVRPRVRPPRAASSVPAVVALRGGGRAPSPSFRHRPLRQAEPVHEAAGPRGPDGGGAAAAGAGRGRGGPVRGGSFVDGGVDGGGRFGGEPLGGGDQAAQRSTAVRGHAGRLDERGRRRGPRQGVLPDGGAGERGGRRRVQGRRAPLRGRSRPHRPVRRAPERRERGAHREGGGEAPRAVGGIAIGELRGLPRRRHGSPTEEPRAPNGDEAPHRRDGRRRPEEVRRDQHGHAGRESEVREEELGGRRGEWSEDPVRREHGVDEGVHRPGREGELLGLAASKFALGPHLAPRDVPRCCFLQRFSMTVFVLRNGRVEKIAREVEAEVLPMVVKNALRSLN
ncbi:hypothetical protein ACHAWF_016992 [Thalassiosira exigua]